jgi:hypothetical protein
MSQVHRVLQMLRAAGPAGLTQLEVLRDAGGGPPILALSQRIGDLRRAGHRIDVEMTRTSSGARVARYRLAGTPPAPPGPMGSEGAELGRLVEIRTAPPREAIFDDDLPSGEPVRGTVASTPPESSWQTTTAQPEEDTLVHVTHPQAGKPA